MAGTARRLILGLSDPEDYMSWGQASDADGGHERQPFLLVIPLVDVDAGAGAHLQVPLAPAFEPSVGRTLINEDVAKAWWSLEGMAELGKHLPGGEHALGYMIVQAPGPQLIIPWRDEVHTGFDIAKCVRDRQFEGRSFQFPLFIASWALALAQAEGDNGYIEKAQLWHLSGILAGEGRLKGVDIKSYYCRNEVEGASRELFGVFDGKGGLEEYNRPNIEVFSSQPAAFKTIFAGLPISDFRQAQERITDFLVRQAAMRAGHVGLREPQPAPIWVPADITSGSEQAVFLCDANGNAIGDEAAVSGGRGQYADLGTLWGLERGAFVGMLAGDARDVQSTGGGRPRNAVLSALMHAERCLGEALAQHEGRPGRGVLRRQWVAVEAGRAGEPPLSREKFLAALRASARQTMGGDGDASAAADALEGSAGEARLPGVFLLVGLPKSGGREAPGPEVERAADLVSGWCRALVDEAFVGEALGVVVHVAGPADGGPAMAREVVTWAAQALRAQWPGSMAFPLDVMARDDLTGFLRHLAEDPSVALAHAARSDGLMDQWVAWWCAGEKGSYDLVDLVVADARTTYRSATPDVTAVVSLMAALARRRGKRGMNSSVHRRIENAMQRLAALDVHTERIWKYLSDASRRRGPGRRLELLSDSKAGVLFSRRLLELALRCELDAPYPEQWLATTDVGADDFFPALLARHPTPERVAAVLAAGVAVRGVFGLLGPREARDLVHGNDERHSDVVTRREGRPIWFPPERPATKGT